MENMQYAEELMREFLIFRGFTNTLRSFEAEISTDIGKGFQVDKILDLIFSVYVPKFEAEKLVGLMGFLKQCFFSPADMRFNSTLAKLELSTIRYYIVYALQKGRQDKVVEFFARYGNDLLHNADDWSPWFAIPYMRNPSMDPQFRVFFSKEWLDTLLVSFRNFLSEIFSGIRLPALLRVSSEQINIRSLKKEIELLNSECSRLRTSLQAKEEELLQLKSFVPPATTANRLDEMRIVQESSRKTILEGRLAQDTSMSKEESESAAAALTYSLDEKDYGKQSSHLAFQASSSGISIPDQDHGAFNNPIVRDAKTSELSTRDPAGESSESVPDGETWSEEDFAEVTAEFQEIFSGHTSPIARCRFSAAGTNVASASVDGTVRIWTYDPSTPTSRNATIYCGAEITSLDWEYKSDRLLLIGTAEGGIKAWNVDAKRVVCDLSTGAAFPNVLDLKCSPVEPIFVSAAASRGHGTKGIERMGFASLIAWNMKTWKPLTVLPLGEDPPAITSVCFNHNGKILAASATDGMIHMFDMSAGLPITGWPAHDSAASCVKFGPDEASIFSLGSDGKIFEWSIHNQGQVLWSQDSSRFISQGSSKLPRHEMALDTNGRRLLVTSNTLTSPLYQIQGKSRRQKTLSHGAPITSVDWHPMSQIFLTGSADHSVRVTSIH